jgi:hypothetical protein
LPDGRDQTDAKNKTLEPDTTVAKDTHGIDVPGRDDLNRATCESCHGSRPHGAEINDKNNDHTDMVACITCHIPYYAHGGKPQ